MRRRFKSEYAFEKHLSAPGSSACRQVVLDMMTHGTEDRKRGRAVDSNTVSHEQARPPPGYRPVAVRQNEGLSVMMNTVDADPVMEEDEVDPPYPAADHADTEVDPLADVPMVAPVEEPVRPPTIVLDKMFFTATTEQVCVAELINLLDDMGCPDYATQRVLNWARISAQKKFDFQPKLETRDAILEDMRTSLLDHGLKGMLPSVTEVPLEGQDNQTAKVVGFDFVPKLLSLIQNNDLMDLKNLVVNPDAPFDNYTTMVDEDTPIGEAQTGTVYQNYVHTKELGEKDLVLGIPLYVDRTHIDSKSRFSACPLTFSLSIFKEECRRDPLFWRELGYLYNVHLQSSAEHKRAPKGHSTRDIHRQLDVLLEVLRKVQDGTDKRLQNVPVTINGETKYVNIICPILCFIVDAVEGDTLCCRKATRSKESVRHSRTCDCPFESLNDVNVACTMLKASVVDALVDGNKKKELDAMTQDNVKSAFRAIEFCDMVHGIFGAQPGDFLHMFALGLVKRALYEMMEALPAGVKKKLDNMARDYNEQLRSSHRHTFFRTSFTRGISNVTQLSATEHIGLMHVLCALIQLGDGWTLLEKPLLDKGLVLKDILQLFEALLSFHEWAKQEQFWSRRDRVEKEAEAQASIRKLLTMLMTTLPRDFGNGWNLSKLHEHTHIVSDITRYGAMNNYNACWGETNHKYHAKKPGRRALKRVAKFDFAIAIRITQTYTIRTFLDLINRAEFRQMEEKYEYEDAVNDDANDTEADERASVVESTAYSTTYTITTTPTPKPNGLAGYDYTTISKWTTRSHGICTVPAELITFLVAEFNMASGSEVRRLKGYTQYKRNDITFRAHPNYRSEGKAWHDWAMMAFTNHNDIEDELPVRFATFISDMDNNPNVFHPNVQWCTRATGRDSALFHEYEFPHDLDGNQRSSYSRHPAACITRPCMVFAPLIGKETNPKNFVMLAVDREDWAEKFV